MEGGAPPGDVGDYATYRDKISESAARKRTRMTVRVIFAAKRCVGCVGTAVFLRGRAVRVVDDVCKALAWRIALGEDM